MGRSDEGANRCVLGAIEIDAPVGARVDVISVSTVGYSGCRGGDPAYSGRFRHTRYDRGFGESTRDTLHVGIEPATVGARPCIDEPVVQ